MSREEDLQKAFMLGRVKENAIHMGLTAPHIEKKLAELKSKPDQCSECGGSGMTEGWTPMYGDPDNSGGAPEAEPCPNCQSHHLAAKPDPLEWMEDHLRSVEFLLRTSGFKPCIIRADWAHEFMFRADEEVRPKLKAHSLAELIEKGMKELEENK